MAITMKSVKNCLLFFTLISILMLSTILITFRYGIFLGLLPNFSYIFLIFIIQIRHKCHKNKISSEEKDGILNLPTLPARFSFEELKIGTENFSHKLGQGGFGSVFKGKLSDNTKVALKRLENGIGQGRAEFLAEVKIIASLHHINVVRLIGFCAEKSHRLLIFEFMENGSLEKWIFGVAIDWQTKAKIITDIAKGLSYLHEECRQEKVRIDGLLDMVDRNGADIELHGDEAMKMMRLAMWCLQTNSSRRPSMSMVVKVLEGNLSVETNLDFNFYTSATLNADDDFRIVISDEQSESQHSEPR